MFASGRLSVMGTILLIQFGSPSSRDARCASNAMHIMLHYIAEYCDKISHGCCAIILFPN